MTSTEGSFVNLDNARLDEQRRVMQDIAANAECPFCPENLPTYHKEPVLREGSQWTLTTNQWPYEFTRLHLLAISRYHAESLADLHEGSFDDLQQLFTWAETTYGIAAGGLAMRFGDVRINGASVKHLHAHLIVPDPNKPADAKVRFKIS